MPSTNQKNMILFVAEIYYMIRLALCQSECKASAAFILLNTGETVRVGKGNVANVSFNITQLCLPKYFPVVNITAYVVTEHPLKRVPFCELHLVDDISCLKNNGCSCRAEDRSVSISSLITQQEKWLIVGSNKQWSTNISLTIHIEIDNADKATWSLYNSSLANKPFTTSPTAYKRPNLPPASGTIPDASNDTDDDIQRNKENEQKTKNSPQVPFIETPGFIITLSIVAVMCVICIVVCMILCITGKRDKATFLKGQNSAVVSRASGLLALLRLRALPPVPDLRETPFNPVSATQRAGSVHLNVSGSSRRACEPDAKQTEPEATKTLSQISDDEELHYNNLDTTDLMYARISGAASTAASSTVPTGSAFKGGNFSVKGEYSNVCKPKKTTSSATKVEVTSPTGDDQRVSSISVLEWPAPPLPLHPLTSDVTDVSAVNKEASFRLGVQAHAHSKPRNNVTITGSHPKAKLKTDGVGYLVPYATVVTEDFC